jgi:hypothetical protein
MTREYRRILENFDLSYKEAKTLSDAEDLLQQMHNDITTSECAYDEDLLYVIDQALEALGKCNPRLNVEISLECKEEEK